MVKGAEDLLIQEAIETLVSGNAEGALEMVEPQLGCGDYNAEMVAASALLALGRELEAAKCLRQMEVIVNRLFAAQQTAEPGFNPGSLLQMLGNLGKEKRVLELYKKWQHNDLYGDLRYFGLGRPSSAPFLTRDNNNRPQKIGIPQDDLFQQGGDIPACWEQRIDAYFRKRGEKIRYIYDFADEWVHKVKLEAVLPAEEGVCYPRCIGGEQAPPPEDSGGPRRYQAEMARASAQAETFDCRSVQFPDSAGCLRRRNQEFNL
ncbi:MAG: plasmid pRiA4b ORF-3 family protein [Dethiobacter sp.]|nr:plasmid pRiA4b ORF-3 family protein [Dethiobacter sp.]